MTSDTREAFIFAHRTNIARYRSLLQANMTVIEREFIERLIEEEEKALLKFIQKAEPVSDIPHRNTTSCEPDHLA